MVVRRAKYDADCRAAAEWSGLRAGQGERADLLPPLECGTAGYQAGAGRGQGSWGLDGECGRGSGCVG